MTISMVLTRYKRVCARLGPQGKSRSLSGVLESTTKNWGSHALALNQFLATVGKDISSQISLGVALYMYIQKSKCISKDLVTA